MLEVIFIKIGPFCYLFIILKVGFFTLVKIALFVFNFFLQIKIRKEKGSVLSQV